MEALPKAMRGEALKRLKTQESTGPAGGLNHRLLAANFQGEQGPEDASLASVSSDTGEGINGRRASTVERRHGSLEGKSSEGKNPKGVTGMKQGRTVRWRAKR